VAEQLLNGSDVGSGFEKPSPGCAHRIGFLPLSFDMMQIIQNGFPGGTPGVCLEKLQSGKDVLFNPVPFGGIADFLMQHLLPSRKRDESICGAADFVCLLLHTGENTDGAPQLKMFSSAFMQIVTY